MADQPGADLVAAIKGATSDTQLQEALLFGAYGESGWNPNSGGPSAGGYWGFTEPYYDAATLWDAPAAQQVAAILPSYQQAENTAPAGLTGAAAMEYIVLGAEKPAFSTPATIRAYPTTVSGGTEYQLGYAYTPGVSIPPGGISQQEVIAETGQPTQYGANSSFAQALINQKFSQIASALSVPDSAVTTSSGNTGGEQTGPPSQSGTSGQRETNANAVTVAQSNLASLNPQKTRNADPSNPRGFVYTMNQYMNPQFEGSATDQQGNKRTFWTGVEDAITGKAELQILGDVTGANTVIHDAELVTNPTNILLAVRQWITRLAVFAVGLGIIFIAVNALTKGSLMNLFSKAPIPIPV
jgi:hypothetical protein